MILISENSVSSLIYKMFDMPFVFAIMLERIVNSSTLSLGKVHFVSILLKLVYCGGGLLVDVFIKNNRIRL